MSASERTAVIAQPTYLPWLGYFEQMSRADIFVALDNVQFEKQSWQSRNRLKGCDDTTFWLTIPVARHSLDTPYREILIAPQEQRWREKHLRSIQGALGKAPYFAELFPKVEAWLRTPFERLVDLNLAGIEIFTSLLGLAPEKVLASNLKAQGSKAEFVAAICREVGANHYWANAGSKDYIEQSRHYFDDAGMRVDFQDWPHPTYAQQGRTFVSHLPALDALMNIGPSATRALIQAPAPDSQNS